MWRGKPGVGIAASKGPTGPFVDQVGTSIMPGDDPTLFLDKRGAVHLCSNNGGPFCGVLNADLKTWRTPLAMLGGYNLTHREWFEAPWIADIGGVYVDS